MAERKKFLLRLPPALHEELRAWAEQEMRSLNGQIEYLLREAAVRRRKSLRRELDAEAPDEPNDS
ncbi:MAG: toxin-antitoxin system HicB family antitoxin [Planctomycetes bacterium]|nr:toxin-antitoxin system HicB family antitoxin [Planctomycetota bacterium]MCB9870009.1 toxin-antitoxin system HicB family antitoxin [Planctomycetota bacterium]